jgi:hypothetical protein
MRMDPESSKARIRAYQMGMAEIMLDRPEAAGKEGKVGWDVPSPPNPPSFILIGMWQQHGVIK